MGLFLEKIVSILNIHMRITIVGSLYHYNQCSQSNIKENVRCFIRNNSIKNNKLFEKKSQQKRCQDLFHTSVDNISLGHQHILFNKSGTIKGNRKSSTDIGLIGSWSMLLCTPQMTVRDIGRQEVMRMTSYHDTPNMTQNTGGK